MGISIKTPEDITLLREGGALLGNIVSTVAAAVRPGMTTKEIDAQAAELIAQTGGQPAFLGFQGYPAATCTSINHVIVHGIPSDEVAVHEGDIIGIDIGLKYKGLFTDMAITVPVGTMKPEIRRLLGVAREALRRGIGAIAPGNQIGDIGAAIQQYVERERLSVVRDLVGHGVGYAVHEEPAVPNYGRRGTGVLLKAGMVLAIEPMVNIGTDRTKTLDDGWTIVTEDGSLSAHFEQTVVVTADGVEIITPYGDVGHFGT